MNILKPIAINKENPFDGNARNYPHFADALKQYAGTQPRGDEMLATDFHPKIEDYAKANKMRALQTEVNNHVPKMDGTAAEKTLDTQIHANRLAELQMLQAQAEIDKKTKEQHTYAANKIISYALSITTSIPLDAINEIKLNNAIPLHNKPKELMKEIRSKIYIPGAATGVHEQITQALEKIPMGRFCHLPSLSNVPWTSQKISIPR
jgi:hypothetical protein